jgi:predicted Ser/Thr protein kinase
LDPNQVRYHTLQEVTGNFAKEWVLGEGSFATVYLGQMAGQKVAVEVDKHVDEGEEQSEETAKMSKMLEQQFVAELTCLYQYRHPNICALMHHSTDGPTRCLVYE